MKNKESGRKGPLIVGGVASATVLALLLALHERGEPVPVVEKTRARVGQTLRSDAGVRMNDAGARMARAAAIRKARQAVSKGTESPPKEPLTKDNALERARNGDIAAAQFVVDFAEDKTRTMMGVGEEVDPDIEDFKRTFSMILGQLGITEDECNTFEAAIEIADILNDLEDPSTLDFNDEDDILDASYGAILEILKEIGPSMANNPLLAQLLERDEQGLRDLVQEVIGRYPTMRQNGNLSNEEPLTDEDIANLRRWYGLDNP